MYIIHVAKTKMYRSLDNFKIMWLFVSFRIPN